MSKPIIKVENLSKSFQINHETNKGGYVAMRDVISDRFKKIFSLKSIFNSSNFTNEDFYALKDLNFEIEQGDRVGIIGRNGAGKSTLLKILSRITEPTTGKITLSGRVASLLEVGTGFHPELTGRENIFLNGAILGMSRFEIRSKFDEIVDFAEVERFLDTPVKRYSSGMYVRLAFAVAAHLEPEILIIDEVLAVGDGQFQKKCLGKMEDISKGQGRTVIFVSHQMSAVKNLCNKGIALSGGKIFTTGEINEVISSYENNAPIDDSNFFDHYKRNVIRILDFNIKVMGASVFEIATGEDIMLNLIFQTVNSNESLKKVSIGFALEDSAGALILINYSEFYNKYYEGNNFDIKAKLDKVPIGSGTYKVHVRITSSNEEIYWNKNIATLIINKGDYFGTGKYGEEYFCKNYHSFEWL